MKTQPYKVASKFVREFYGKLSKEPKTMKLFYNEASESHTGSSMRHNTLNVTVQAACRTPITFAGKSSRPTRWPRSPISSTPMRYGA